MCWNAAVSLNTFLFSSFVLILIYYNNTYTQYKIKDFNSIWVYLFFASFILMQLIEFFIWRNLQDKFYNNMFSILAILLIVIQPIASLMLLRDHAIRNVLLSIYLLLAVPFSIYNLVTKQIYSEKSKAGDLQWNFFRIDSLIWISWLFFFLFSFVYNKIWPGLIFGLISLLAASYNYAKDRTEGSIWCWAVNGLMIYYAAYLLFYLPFCDKKQLC